MLSFLHKRHVILIADKLSVVLLVIIIWTLILSCLKFKCCLPGHSYVHSNYFTGETTKVPMLNDSTYMYDNIKYIWLRSICIMLPLQCQWHWCFIGYPTLWVAHPYIRACREILVLNSQRKLKPWVT